MEESDEKKEQPKENVHEDSSFTVSEAERPTLIRLEDGKVNVSVLKLSMSKKHRVVMTIDLWLIAWVSAMTSYMAMLESLAPYRWIVVTIGCFSVMLAIGKTITDMMNWIFTMNVMLEQMGDWYIDDVVGICQDFIGAGVKFAAEEVKKATNGKSETETKDGEGASPNP